MARWRVAGRSLRRDPDRRGALSRSRQPVRFRRGAGIRRARRGPRTRRKRGVNPSKGDRLLRPVDIVSDKQTFKAPTIIKVGDREVVKARPFTRLQTTLTITPTGFADAVPPFNPLKITNGGTDVAEAPPDPGPVQDNAEVTFRVEDLTRERRGADLGRTDAGRGGSAGRRDAESVRRRPKRRLRSRCRRRSC